MKTMKWKEVAEFTGITAIVGSLIFVGLQQGVRVRSIAAHIVYFGIRQATPQKPVAFVR